MSDRKCFVCRKPIAQMDEGRFCDPPRDATAWTTCGNFGSTVYDSNHWQLEILICDSCLRERADLAVEFRANQQLVEVEYETRPYSPR